MQFIALPNTVNAGINNLKKFDALRVYAKKMPPRLAWARGLKTKLGENASRQHLLKQTRTSPPNRCAPRPAPEPTQLAGDGGGDEDKPLPKSNSIRNADPYRICPFEFSPHEVIKKPSITLLVKLYKSLCLSLSLCATHHYFS